MAYAVDQQVMMTHVDGGESGGEQTHAAIDQQVMMTHVDGGESGGEQTHTAIDQQVTMTHVDGGESGGEQATHSVLLDHRTIFESVSVTNYK